MSKKLDNRFLFGFIGVAALFLLVVISHIGATLLYPLQPGMQPTIKYRPKPPSCCGDSICLMENHHG